MSVARLLIKKDSRHEENGKLSEDAQKGRPRVPQIFFAAIIEDISLINTTLYNSN